MFKKILNNKTSQKRSFLMSKTKKNKMSKKININQINGKQIIVFFLCMLNTIKLYHWKTSSYSQHKATDSLYESLNSHIDKFIEVYLGKNSRVDLSKMKSIPLNDFNSLNELKKNIINYKNFLISMSLPPEDSDLLTIRDELLIDLNQFLYLLTLQ
jgi:DNA-binding ferritin-like protein